MGSAPILDRPSYGAYYQSHETSDVGRPAARETPDHYPLVTRAGTVPVEELSERGLFSQARYRAAYDDAAFAPAALVEADYDPDVDGARWAAREEAVRVVDVPQHDLEAQAPADSPAVPLALSAGPVSLTQSGQAKSIDVSAVLAMR